MYGELYRRKDGKWSWRLRAENGKIIATDGAQGYENRVDAIKMFDKVTCEGRVIRLKQLD